MARRKKNPIPEALIYATGTTVGIVVGTILATWIVESLRATGSLPGSAPSGATAIIPAPPTELPPGVSA